MPRAAHLFAPPSNFVPYIHGARVKITKGIIVIWKSGCCLAGRVVIRQHAMLLFSARGKHNKALKKHVCFLRQKLKTFALNQRRTNFQLVFLTGENWAPSKHSLEYVEPLLFWIFVDVNNERNHSQFEKFVFELLKSIKIPNFATHP
jgi:hypothetical protein